MFTQGVGQFDGILKYLKIKYLQIRVSTNYAFTSIVNSLKYK
jgi:hypothetical protein